MKLILMSLTHYQKVKLHLQNQNQNLSTNVRDLTDLSTRQQKQISDLILQNTQISSNISLLTNAITEGATGGSEAELQERDRLNALQAQTIQSLRNQVGSLNTQVKTLMDQLSATMNQLADANGLPQNTKPIFSDENILSQSAVAASLDKVKGKIKSIKASNMNK